jgi:hypothetical protein
MFRCEVCSCVVSGRAQRLVETRTRVYPRRVHANSFQRTKFINGRWKRKQYITDDPGGRGIETVREMKVCPECAKRRGIG